MTPTTKLRCGAVWAAATIALAVGLGLLHADVRAVLALVTRVEGGVGFDVLLGHLAGTALLLCIAWMWVVTTTVVLTASRAASSTQTSRDPVRRMILAVCGLAAWGGLALPAHASTLDGLPLPDRASAPRSVPSSESTSAPRPVTELSAAPAPAQPPALRVRVRAGDSLWALATATWGEAPNSVVAARVRDIHSANRRVIGPDPDLIHPGQVLHLPGAREERS